MSTHEFEPLSRGEANPEAKIVSPKRDESLFDSELAHRAELKGKALEGIVDTLISRNKELKKRKDAIRLSDFEGLTMKDLLATKQIGLHRVNEMGKFFVWDRSPRRAVKHRKFRGRVTIRKTTKLAVAIEISRNLTKALEEYQKELHGLF